MIEGRYEKESGQIIILPDGFKLDIQETSNGVYRINMFDQIGRNVSNHGTSLDEMVEEAIKDLKKMGR